MRKYEQASCKEMNATNLEKLAKAINEKWPMHRFHMRRDGLEILCMESNVSYGVRYEDIANAAFIVWALDRLEELGCGPLLFKDQDKGFYVQFLVQSEDQVEWNMENTHAPTRAEALATALLRALAVEEPVREES